MTAFYYFCLKQKMQKFNEDFNLLFKNKKSINVKGERKW